MIALIDMSWSSWIERVAYTLIMFNCAFLNEFMDIYHLEYELLSQILTEVKAT